MVERHYYATIIGDGQAGGPLASAFAGAGRRTAVIERERAGGSYVNVRCTSTKTVVASACVAYVARRAAGFRVQASAVAVDLGTVRQRKRAIVESFRTGSEQRLERGASIS
jgi:pyruvate/2-oxoglutarate dehydrogenase complex dihydrolipoamide dehydrogenase (E3) component